MNDYSQIEDLIENGEFENAIENINHSLQFVPNNSYLLNLLSICYLSTYDYSNAQQIINKVLDLQPEDEFAKYNLDFLNKKLKMANNLYLCIKSLKDSSFKLYYIHEINLIKDAIEIDNTDEDYIFFLGFLHLLAKQFNDFNQVFDYLTKNNSKYSDYIKIIKQNLDSLNYQNLEDDNKTFNDLKYHYNSVEERVYNLYRYAESFYNNNNLNMALSTIEQALKLNIYNSTILNFNIFRCYLISALINYELQAYKSFSNNIFNAIFLHPIFYNINLTYFTDDSDKDYIIKNNFKKYITIFSKIKISLN